MNKMTERLKYIDVYPDKLGTWPQKLKKKKDKIELVRKSYVVERGEVDEDARTIIATVSTRDKDREGEVIIPEGIDLSSYEKNPILMWAHRYSDPPIGRSQWQKKSKDGLIMKFEFAKTQLADEIYQLYKDKFLKGFSIGFIPLDFDEENKIHKKIALLEVSAVPVPANQNALIMEAYQKGIITCSGLKEDLEIEIEKDDPEIIVDELEVEVAKEKQLVDKLPIFIHTSNGKKLSKEKLEELAEMMKETITKPETTEKYHRIPVNPGCEVTATITISAKQGIKAIYCGKVKKVHTYLFDIEKWSMAEAQAWVRDHKSLLDRYEKLLGEKEMEDTTIVNIDNILQEVPDEELEEEKVLVDIDDAVQEIPLPTELVIVDEIFDEAKHEPDDHADLKEAIGIIFEDIQEQLSELKEGRVLSSKNRTLVKETIDVLTELREKLEQLYNATEPPQSQEGEREVAIERDVHAFGVPQNVNISNGVQEAIKEALSPEKIKEILKQSIADETDRIRGRVR